jgi:hypothetical protein
MRVYNQEFLNIKRVDNMPKLEKGLKTWYVPATGQKKKMKKELKTG